MVQQAAEGLQEEEHGDERAEDGVCAAGGFVELSVEKVLVERELCSSSKEINVGREVGTGGRGERGGLTRSVICASLTPSPNPAIRVQVLMIWIRLCRTGDPTTRMARAPSGNRSATVRPMITPCAFW